MLSIIFLGDLTLWAQPVWIEQERSFVASDSQSVSSSLMTMKDNLLVLDCNQLCEPNHWFGLNYNPEMDLNIYLTVGNSIASNVRISCGWSLNHQGVVNVTSVIRIPSKRKMFRY